MIRVERIGRGEVGAVQAASHLFDRSPESDWTGLFLTREGHHLFIAYVNGSPAGFVTGIEITHPDKRTEMLLYELGVDASFRGRGIGSTLVQRLLEHARRRGCRGMWVTLDPDNEPAIATYRSAGAEEPEAAAIMSWRIT